MTEPMPPLDDEGDALAAELALGVLEGEARAQAMRRALADPGFAAAVAAWEARFAGLCDEWAEAPPPAGLWDRIEPRLVPLGSGGDVAAIRAQLRRWRAGAIGTGAVAAALALVLLVRPGGEPVPGPTPAPTFAAAAPVVVAVLRGEGDGPVLTARYQPGDGALRIRADDMPESRLVPELWVIPADGVPRSLGAVARHGVSSVQVAVPHRKLIHDGAVLAITMEPESGLPHAKPSAAPVAAGKISTI